MCISKNSSCIKYAQLKLIIFCSNLIQFSLSILYYGSGQEQYTANQRNASPDRYNIPYGERTDYRSSPYRYNNAGGSPSRYAKQEDQIAEDPIVRYGAYRNGGVNNVDPIEPFKHKMRYERDDPSRKSYDSMYRGAEPQSDQYNPRQMYQYRNGDATDVEGMNSRKNYGVYEPNSRDSSYYTPVTNSGSPYRRSQAQPQEYKQKEYPTYPGGYHNMNPDPVERNTDDFYNEQNQYIPNNYMPNQYDQYSRASDLQDPRAKYRQPEGYAVSPDPRRQDVNSINPNDTPEKELYNHRKSSYHGKGKHHGSKRAKSHANHRGHNKEDPIKRPYEMNYQRIQDVNYQSPQSNKYNPNPYVPGSIYNQNPYSREGNNYERDNMSGSSYNERERYRNVNMGNMRAPSNRIDLPQRTDQMRQNKPSFPEPPKVLPRRHEEVKSSNPANLNESINPKVKETPVKIAEEGPKPKGAFNMLLSPEIAAKAGGWSIVASPDGKDKTTKVDETKKAIKMEGIQKGPLRL